jgi:RHS repeat-associated protein
MQLSSGTHIPDGLLAAMTLRNENSRLGVPTKNPALHQGIDASKSQTAMGLQTLTTTARVRSRCTGKERDAESGLDYFGARYNSSNMGRFMSPDPLGGNLANPQSLNKYSYVLNNPLTNTDPTGLYTCTDSSDCSSKQDKALEKSLAGLRNSKNADVARAAGAYGAANDKNGVSVGFADLSKKGEDGSTTSRIGSLDGGNTASAISDVTINSKSSGSSLDAAIGHEGSHVADAQDVVKSGLTADAAGNVIAGTDITRYQSEQRAYGVTNSILTSEGEHGNFGCDGCNLGQGTMQGQVPGIVDRIVGTSGSYTSGGRPMGPSNQGGSVVNGVGITPKATVPQAPH